MIDPKVVARAICIADGDDFCSQKCLQEDEPRGCAYLPEARAAIASVLEQMEEPSEGMIEAGIMARERQATVYDNSIATWRAMLARAKEEVGK